MDDMKTAMERSLSLAYNNQNAYANGIENMQFFSMGRRIGGKFKGSLSTATSVSQLPSS